LCYDIPGKDVALAGVNCKTKNFLEAPFDKITTTRVVPRNC